MGKRSEDEIRGGSLLATPQGTPELRPEPEARRAGARGPDGPERQPDPPVTIRPKARRSWRSGSRSCSAGPRRPGSPAGGWPSCSTCSARTTARSRSPTTSELLGRRPISRSARTSAPATPSIPGPTTRSPRSRKLEGVVAATERLGASDGLEQGQRTLASLADRLDLPPQPGPDTRMPCLALEDLVEFRPDFRAVLVDENLKFSHLVYPVERSLGSSLISHPISTLPKADKFVKTMVFTAEIGS